MIRHFANKAKQPIGVSPCFEVTTRKPPSRVHVRNGFGLLILAMMVVVLAAVPLNAAEPVRSPGERLSWFSQNYDEQAWKNKSKRRPQGYMRPLNDQGWQNRMLAMQDLVEHGPSAIPALLEALKTGKPAKRILAAQVLGYLALHAPESPLFQAARGDKNPAVRLYAVDALGMIGKDSSKIDWDLLRKSARNRDVSKHIGYAVDRKTNGIAPQVVDSLRAWNPKTINTAKVGEAAPDFELTAATGEKHRLSSYRGRKAVVLVFIYGDT